MPKHLFFGTPKQILSLKTLVFRAFFTILLSCIMRRRNNAQILLSNFMNNSQKVSKIKASSDFNNGCNMEGRKFASKMDYFRADIIILTYRKHSSIKGFRA